MRSFAHFPSFAEKSSQKQNTKGQRRPVCPVFPASSTQILNANLQTESKQQTYRGGEDFGHDVVVLGEVGEVGGGGVFEVSGRRPAARLHLGRWRRSASVHGVAPDRRPRHRRRQCLPHPDSTANTGKVPELSSCLRLMCKCIAEASTQHSMRVARF